MNESVSLKADQFTKGSIEMTSSSKSLIYQMYFKEHLKNVFSAYEHVLLTLIFKLLLLDCSFSVLACGKSAFSKLASGKLFC